MTLLTHSFISGFGMLLGVAAATTLLLITLSIIDNYINKD